MLQEMVKTFITAMMQGKDIEGEIIIHELSLLCQSQRNHF